MRRSIRPDHTALVAASMLLALLLPTLPASAAAESAESWPVPDQATIALDGLGFGHGRGLSQYGALGRGRDGQGYRDIVEFYYPGTEWGTAGGTVKVLVTRDTSDDVVVGARRGLTLRALAAGKRWKLPERVRKNRSSRKTVPVKRWRIVPARRGRSAISYRAHGWHDWRTVRGDAEFAASGRPVALHTPDGVVAYRGTLRSATPPGAPTRRDTVNVVKLDAYLKGVVPSEVIASVWPAETIKAQAVAARTYAAYERDHAPSARHYEICDTASCQVYGGYSAEYPTSNNAVRATARQVLTYAGSPVFAQFSASNGGYSVAGSFEYLVAQADPFDHYDPDREGGDGWATEVTSADIENAYNIENLSGISIDSRDGLGEWGGRVQTITLTTAKGGQYPVTGDSFRRNLGLRSTYFTITGVDETP